MNVKLCVDCKWHRRSFFYPFSGELDKCAHPSVASLVNGRAHKYCDLMRDYGTCLKDARLFEAKKGWFK